MEFGLREVLIGVGLLVIAGILFDGFRRMRRSKTGSLDMSSEMGGSMDDDWEYYRGELPNGGARSVSLSRHEPGFDEEDAVVTPSRREPDFSSDFVDPEIDDMEPMVADASDRIQHRRAAHPESEKNVEQENAAQQQQRAENAQRRVMEPDPFAEPPAEDNVQDYVTQSLTDEPVDRSSDAYQEVQTDLFSDDEMLERAKQEQERKLASHYRADPRPAPSRARKVEAPRREAAPEPELSQETDMNLGMNDIADVLVVNVMAKPGTEIQGDDLYRAMSSCGFRHGDMNIFHRFEQHNGGGRLLFSIANVVEPGTFEPAPQADFTTPGICMFLKLPGPKRPLQAFEVMLDCARKVANLLGADMKDEHHSVMTQQTFEHYRQRVIDFERKQLSQKALTR